MRRTRVPQSRGSGAAVARVDARARFKGFACLVVVIAVFFATLTSAVHAASAEARGRALLIGVGDYLAAPDLPGARNDIAMMRRILETKLGFASRDIETLLDGQATRTAILAALRKIAAEAGPTDTVYIHYSGHGSQVADRNGDEEDGLDETLVPHDGRTNGVPDITDDELGEILGRVATPHLIVVLDSCHSGTALRGAAPAVTTRALPPDTREALYPEAITERAVVELNGEHAVLFTGAAHDEAALDAKIDGQRYGIFSYALGRSLTALGGHASPKALLDRSGQELLRIQAKLSLSRLPEPQLEGPPRALSQPLLERNVEANVPPTSFATATQTARPSNDSAPSSARLPWAEVVVAGDDIQLIDAEGLGATPGSLWAVYPQGEEDFALGEAVARVRVIEMTGVVAHAKQEMGEPLASRGRAIRIYTPAGARESWLAWRAGPAPLRQRIEAELRKLRVRARFTDEPRLAELTLDANGDQIRIRGLDGETELATFESGAVSDIVAFIQQRLQHAFSAAELLALDNPATAFRIDFGIVGDEPPAVPEEPAPNEPSRAIMLVADTAAPPIRVRVPGEPRTQANSLQLRFESDRDCHLTLIDLDARGTVSQIFPNALSERRRYYPGGAVPANEPILIPDRLTPGNRAGFFIDYAPPTGQTTIMALCTETPELASAMRQRLTSAELIQETQRSSGPAISDIALRGFVKVGPGKPSVPPSDWATAAVVFEVFE